MQENLNNVIEKYIKSKHEIAENLHNEFEKEIENKMELFLKSSSSSLNDSD